MLEEVAFHVSLIMLRSLCEFKWYFDLQINVIKVTFTVLIKKRLRLSNNMFLILAMGVDGAEWSGVEEVQVS